MSKTKHRKPYITARRFQVSYLLRSGTPAAEIAKKLKMPLALALKDIDAVKTWWALSVADTRRQELGKLEAAARKYQAKFEETGDPKFADLWLDAIDRKCRLLGLYVQN